MERVDESLATIRAILKFRWYEKKKEYEDILIS
jgi:hypothetical protein